MMSPASRRLNQIMLVFVVLAVACEGAVLTATAQSGVPTSVARQLCAAARTRYPGHAGVTRMEGGRRVLVPGMSYYRIVPYKNRFFGYTSGWNESDTALCAVWEYVDGGWRFVFDHGTRGAIEGDYGNYLDPMYAKYGFSSSMRRKLTGGPGHDF